MGVFLLNQVITSGALIVIIILLRAVVGHRMSQRLRYGLWMLVVVKLIVPIPVENSLNIANIFDAYGYANMTADKTTDRVSYTTGSSDADRAYESVHKQDNTDIINKYNTTVDADKTYNNIQNNNKNNNVNSDNQSLTGNNISGDMKADTRGLMALNIASLAIIIWIVGVIAVGAVLIISNILFLSKLRISRRYIKTYNNKLCVYVSDEVSGPCLAGLIHPAIYLPDDNYLDRDYAQYILLHEWVHYRHLDLVWAAVRGVILSLYWFDPLVWIAAKLSIRDSELACDEGVLVITDDNEHKKYGKMLIDICESMPVKVRRLQPTQATQMLGESREMKDRIKNIAAYTRQSAAIFVCAVVIAVVAVGCTYGQSADSITNKTAEVSDDESDIQAVSGEATSPATDDNTTDYNSLYEEFVKNLATKSENKNIYYSVVDLDTPVLLVTDLVMDDYGGYTTASADIYMYVEDEKNVVKLAEAHSTGSGYPIIFCDGYIITGFHHESDRFYVQDGELYKEIAEGFYSENEYGYHSIDKFNYYSTIRTLDEKLDIKSIEEMDYYGLSFDKAGAYNIRFESVYEGDDVATDEQADTEESEETINDDVADDITSEAQIADSDGDKGGIFIVSYIFNEGISYRKAYAYKDVFPNEDTGNSIGQGDELYLDFADDVKFYLIKAPTSENENMRLEKVSKSKFKNYQEKYYRSQEAYSYGVKYYKGMLCIIEVNGNGKVAKVKEMYQE